MKLNLEKKGTLVVYLNIKPQPHWEWPTPVDFTDYTHPRIKAIIPCWQDAKGHLTSLVTGEPVVPRGVDQVRLAGVGTAFHFEDGTQIILTRGWKDGKYQEFLTEKKCRDCECINVRVFGE